MPKPIQIGKYDQRVTFQRPTYATGTSGSRTIAAWADIDPPATRWAIVEALPGSEAIEQEQFIARRKVRIRIRYAGAEITPEMRAVHLNPTQGNRTYQIDSVAGVGRDAETIIEATETHA